MAAGSSLSLSLARREESCVFGIQLNEVFTRCYGAGWAQDMFPCANAPETDPLEWIEKKIDAIQTEWKE